jgi:hypothetical protein
MTLVVLATVETGCYAGLAWLRRRVVGPGSGRAVLVVSGVTVAALIVGTAAAVSGVALAVPVLAAMVVLVWRSPWRIGEVALLALAAGVGGALGYQVATMFDPDTGSYGDQGAVALAMLAALLGGVALVSGWVRLHRRVAKL